MSHPERLSSSGGEPVGTISESPRMNGQSSESLAGFAARHGLKQSAARPPLTTYVQQVWQRRTFIWNFASAKTSSMYTSSRLGQLWQVLTPLLNVGVYYLIFGVMLNTKHGVTHFIPFLVTGVFIFTFTQRSVTAGAKSISGNLSLIRALHFPRASLPFAHVIVELQQLLISMVVLFALLFAFGETPSFHMLLIVPMLLLQMCFNMGLSLVLARVGAFTPDIQQLLPFILRTWLYASGVIFAIPAIAQDRLKNHPWLIELLKANPGSVYVELARTSLIDSYRTKDLPELGWSDNHLWWYAIAWAVIALVGGFWYFHRAEERYGRG
ncbi:ABC transporter permease [Actinomadura rudentiformis]|uniref:Transport permease protein n=1 Tax=Actinomadura rudentiformis TaxID=359158 RepID=A0A6H9YI32_9ACTN|nr:ABC transporter permease [Actinomadura rudentiformis]KAB2342106.1 ABC transporter permease [Actinomadura rudentiformis]